MHTLIDLEHVTFKNKIYHTEKHNVSNMDEIEAHILKQKLDN